MLSICIPTYRYDVRPLVAELLQQAVEIQVNLGAEVEILIYDDASPNNGDWGREELRKQSGIHYVELEHNLGRAAIRNKLARDAQFQHLLLMDADGGIHTKFLRNYLLFLQEIMAENARHDEDFVIVGGRKYAHQSPANPALGLHWRYGSQRESRSVDRRKKDGWLGFQSNNFVTTKKVLHQFPFPEDVEGYGHEDTLWGQQLATAGIKIHHFYNAVIHLGLETNDVFLHKQREAISNLALLHQQSPHLRTRLIDLAKKYPFLKHVIKYFPEDWLVRRLMSSSKPSFYWLDILKLKWWFAAHK